MENTKITPIRFPVELLSELDKFVGERQRSRFIIEATRKELIKVKQKEALRSAAGIFEDGCYPEFATTNDVSTWVRKLREVCRRVEQ